MADLSIVFAGIKAPNPFWLASAPPTDKAYNVVRAFEAGWGGVVWKTLGEDPAAVNVSSRYSAHFGANREVLGINNIELITDRSLEINLREITQVKKDWPDRALIVSLMVPCVEESWKNILPLVEATGCDGIELNFGCPHGMPERGMGAAVGQVPEYVEQVTRWCKTYCSLPVTKPCARSRAPCRRRPTGHGTLLHASAAKSLCGCCRRLTPRRHGRWRGAACTWSASSRSSMAFQRCRSC